jgi:hypothetical protein
MEKSKDPLYIKVIQVDNNSISLQCFVSTDSLSFHFMIYGTFSQLKDFIRKRYRDEYAHLQAAIGYIALTYQPGERIIQVSYKGIIGGTLKEDLADLLVLKLRKILEDYTN